MRPRATILSCSSAAHSLTCELCYFAAISPASWREGQKLVKMVLGPVPQLPREEDSPHAADLLSRTGENGKLSPNSKEVKLNSIETEKIIRSLLSIKDSPTACQCDSTQLLVE